MKSRTWFEGTLASLVQRGKDGAHPAVIRVSAAEVEVWVVLVMLEILSILELLVLGPVHVVQVVGMFLAVTSFEMWKTHRVQFNANQ